MNAADIESKVPAAVVVALAVMLSAPAFGAESTGTPMRRYRHRLPGWQTDTTRRSIELQELAAGGPGKDRIPAIFQPQFVKPRTAQRWLNPREPVISLTVDDESRAYPLQILMWHEIVNDTVAGVPVAVTFCPLCYSADVFDRHVDGRVLTFGVSGFLRGGK